MAIPGLDFDAISESIQEKQTAVYELKPNTEWRFEIPFDRSVEVKLLSGTAELFGTELAVQPVEPYTFQGTKAAIFTWHGCKLEVTGTCSSDYVAEETPITSYNNLHFALEAIRDEAAASKSMGPRVLVLGPENAGKTSLVKLLAAYAYRSGRTPLVVNLDPKEGFLTVPGTISASAIESILDITTGWGSSPINGPSQIPVKLPLVYQYGMEHPDTLRDYFEAIVRRLSLNVMKKLEADESTRYTGCIIDTAGSSSMSVNDYGIIQHIVSELQVNLIVILGSERLEIDMSRIFKKHGIPVLRLDKSGGCVERDASFLQDFRNRQVREYFAGTPSQALTPHASWVSFDEVQIYKVGGNDPSHLLPGDNSQTSAGKMLKLTEPDNMMESTIMALVRAKTTDSLESIRESTVIGFVFVKDVDVKGRRLRVLAPAPGKLPKGLLVWGSYPEITNHF